MSTQRSIQRHSSVTIGLIKLAAPIHSQLEENDLECILADLPGVRSVEFPHHNDIQVKYDPHLVGERQLRGAVRLGGYVPLE